MTMRSAWCSSAASRMPWAGSCVGNRDLGGDAQLGETLDHRIDQAPHLAGLRGHGHVSEGVTDDDGRVVLLGQADGERGRLLRVLGTVVAKQDLADDLLVHGLLPPAAGSIATIAARYTCPHGRNQLTRSRAGRALRHRRHPARTSWSSGPIPTRAALPDLLRHPGVHLPLSALRLSRFRAHQDPLPAARLDRGAEIPQAVHQRLSATATSRTRPLRIRSWTTSSRCSNRAGCGSPPISPCGATSRPW